MAANLPSIAVTDDINSPDYDAIVVVSPDVKSISLDRVKDPLTTYLSSNRILPSIFCYEIAPILIHFACCTIVSRYLCRYFFTKPKFSK